MDHLGTTDSAAQFKSEQPAAIDIDLPCPHCDYNLRGLTEDRCPECGWSVDRQRLLEWTAKPDLPLTFRPVQESEGDWWTLVRTTLFRPDEMGRWLPPCPDRRESRRYGLLLRSLAAAAALLAATIPSASRQVGFREALSGLIDACSLVCASWVCECLIALPLAVLVKARFIPKGGGYRFWRTLCMCFCVFLLLNILSRAMFVVLRPLLGGFQIGGGLRISDLYILFPLAIFLWWWLALSKAIAARSVSGPTTTRLASWLILPLGLLSIIFYMILMAIPQELIHRLR